MQTSFGSHDYGGILNVINQRIPEKLCQQTCAMVQQTPQPTAHIRTDSLFYLYHVRLCAVVFTLLYNSIRMLMPHTLHTCFVTPLMLTLRRPCVCLCFELCLSSIQLCGSRYDSVLFSFSTQFMLRLCSSHFCIRQTAKRPPPAAATAHQFYYDNKILCELYFCCRLSHTCVCVQFCVCAVLCEI